MDKIFHRVNSLELLRTVPDHCGAEVDVRYLGEELILEHDAFKLADGVGAVRLQDFLSEFKLKGPLILNVKTEGIEVACIELLRKYNCRNWFFLDLSMPMAVKYSILAAEGRLAGFGPENIAVRFSEYEAIEYSLQFAGRAGWVWVDCFTRMPLDMKSYNLLKEAGFRICLVSPELQGHSLDRIADFRRLLADMKVDAVCSKRPDLW